MKRFRDKLNVRLGENHNSTINSNVPYTFENLLPLTLKLYAKKDDFFAYITTLRPFEKIRSVFRLSPEMEIHATYFDNVKEYEILEPVFLRKDTRHIRFGDVQYDETNNLLTQRTHSDLAGLRFHNRLGVPIEIYFIKGHKCDYSHRPLLLAKIGSNDGTTYHSGSPNSVYINNDYNGFNFGDEIEIKIGKSDICQQLKYCSIKITDNYASDVFVGVISQKYTIPVQDFYSYKIDNYNINAVQYIMNNGDAYKTYMSPFIK